MQRNISHKLNICHDYIKEKLIFEGKKPHLGGLRGQLIKSKMTSTKFFNKSSLFVMINYQKIHITGQKLKFDQFNMLLSRILFILYSIYSICGT